MIGILTGSFIISVLHAIIPSHWLPVLAIAKQQEWTRKETLRVTLLLALAHTASTVFIGLVLGLIGVQVSDNIDHLLHIIAPVILITMGIVFIIRHHRHKHFQLDKEGVKNKSKKAIILALSFAMFLSPCLEIEAYFLLAGTHSLFLLVILAIMYSTTTIVGMLLLVGIAFKELRKFDSHKLEHNAGIITGWVLIITGIVSFFLH